MKNISIIIVNWNGRDMLKNCLDSVYRQSFKDFEVIVSDNGSTDGSVELINKMFPGVKLIENKKNLGFAEGNNVAIRQASGEYIFTLNNDTTLEKNCLNELVKIMGSNPQIGMVAPKIIFNGNKEIDTLGHLLYKSLLPRDCKTEENVDKVVSACAGAALYKKEALEDVRLGEDYFDSDFFLYAEDLDLGLRLRLRNWRYAYAGKAVVNHLHGASSKRVPDKVIFYSQRNVPWTIVKNIPGMIIARNLGWILAGQIACVISYFLRGRPILIIKSKFAALTRMPRMLTKRKEIMNRRLMPNTEFNDMQRSAVFK